MSNRPRRPNSRAGGKVPFIALDQSSSQPLYDQVYAAVRAHILSGHLTRGAKLASSRELAIELGISRFTIVTAFDALIAEGYLMTAQRGGTFVAQVLPDLALRAKSSEVPRGKPTTSRAVTEHRAEDLSARGRSIAAITITGPRSPADEPRPFHPRRAPVDLFPVALWSRLVRRQWRARRHQMLEYGEPGGLPGLREAIAQHASSTRGVACTADQVVITSGAQQAFNLIFHLLLNPGDTVWLEEPGYLDARGALAASGARIVPVPVDREGIVVEAGIAAAADAKLAYVSPSHQYPTGASMSASRRLELLAWAHQANAWIVEDDYDSYFRYRGRPLPACSGWKRINWSTAGQMRLAMPSRDLRRHVQQDDVPVASLRLLHRPDQSCSGVRQCAGDRGSQLIVDGSGGIGALHSRGALRSPSPPSSIRVLRTTRSHPGVDRSPPRRRADGRADECRHACGRVGCAGLTESDAHRANGARRGAGRVSRQPVLSHSARAKCVDSRLRRPHAASNRHRS